MSTIHTLTSVDICCPHCGEEFEVFDLDICVTVEGKDVCSREGEGFFIVECDHCSKDIEISSQLFIRVGKKVTGASQEQILK